MRWMDIIGGFGVLFLVTISYLLGGWRDARLKDIRQAYDRLRQDYLDFTYDDGVLDTEGAAALLAEAGTERLGLVFGVGDAFATRILKPGDVIAISFLPAEDDSAKLKISLSDFSKPELIMAFASGNDAGRWHERISAKIETKE